MSRGADIPRSRDSSGRAGRVEGAARRMSPVDVVTLRQERRPRGVRAMLGCEPSVDADARAARAFRPRAERGNAVSRARARFTRCSCGFAIDVVFLDRGPEGALGAGGRACLAGRQGAGGEGDARARPRARRRGPGSPPAIGSCAPDRPLRVRGRARGVSARHASRAVVGERAPERRNRPARRRASSSPCRPGGRGRSGTCACRRPAGARGRGRPRRS